MSLTVAVVAPEVLGTPITVYREISWWYFAAEAILAVAVLRVALWLRDHTALTLFVVLGVFNVLFEVVGVLG